MISGSFSASDKVTSGSTSESSRHTKSPSSDHDFPVAGRQTPVSRNAVSPEAKAIKQIDAQGEKDVDAIKSNLSSSQNPVPVRTDDAQSFEDNQQLVDEALSLSLDKPKSKRPTLQNDTPHPLSKNGNIKFQSPSQKLAIYRRVQARSLGNEHSRLNAKRKIALSQVRQQTNPGATESKLERFANRRAHASTVLVEAKSAKFSQQSVTAKFNVSADSSGKPVVKDAITVMSDSMKESGFNSRHGAMKGTLMDKADVIVSHDNRRLIAAKTADVWVPMKLEHPDIQNIDSGSAEIEKAEDKIRTAEQEIQDANDKPTQSERDQAIAQAQSKLEAATKELEDAIGKATFSADRSQNSVNDFLIRRTSPSIKEGPDPDTERRGFSVGFDATVYKKDVSYQSDEAKAIKKSVKKSAISEAEKTMVSKHPTILGPSSPKK